LLYSIAILSASLVILSITICLDII
jgi:hypothetical protein